MRVSTHKTPESIIDMCFFLTALVLRQFECVRNEIFNLSSPCEAISNLSSVRRFSWVTSATRSIYGLSTPGPNSNHSVASSFRTAGAKGLKDSRNFIFKLMFSGNFWTSGFQLLTGCLANVGQTPFCLETTPPRYYLLSLRIPLLRDFRNSIFHKWHHLVLIELQLPRL